MAGLPNNRKLRKKNMPTTIGLSTQGKEFHAGKMVPVSILGLEGLDMLGCSDRMKVVFIKNGNGMLQNKEKNEFLISPALVFLNREPGVRVHIDPSNADGMILFFHPNFVNDILEFGSSMESNELSFTDRQDVYLLRHFMPLPDSRCNTLAIEPTMARFFSQLFDQMRNELSVQPDWYWPCRSRSFFLQILTMIDRVEHEAETRAPECAPLCETIPWIDPAIADSELVSIINWLMCNIRNKITIEELAREFNTNRTTMQMKFRNATGMSIAQYIIRLRIRLASILLRDTSLTVLEIMQRTGFEDTSHFTRMFRRYANSNPSAYRALFRIPRYIQSK
jgi:AraC-like DNA-binding protein